MHVTYLRYLTYVSSILGISDTPIRRLVPHLRAVAAKVDVAQGHSSAGLFHDRGVAQGF